MIKDFLFEYCDLPFISGFERMYPDILPRYFKPYITGCDKDNRGSYIFSSKGVNGRKIMLIAHTDELGLIITSISPEGYAGFAAIGFIDPASLVGQEVRIFGRKETYAVIAVDSKRKHDPESSNKAITFADLYLDAGLSKEKLEKRISIGDVCIIKRNPCSLLGSRMSARGLDDKSGVAVMLQTAKELSQISHKSDVYYAAVVQEEGPGLGGKISTFKVNPDIGIILDVGFGASPGLTPDRALTLGKGSAVALGSRFNDALIAKYVEVARKYGLGIQFDVLPGSSGTDAESVQISRKGIPCILISIPLRYMHTAVETLDINDVEQIGKAIALFINEIDNMDMEELLCF